MVLGLLVSSLAPNQSVAPLLTILVLVPQVVFGGGILPVSEFKDSGKTLNQLMMMSWLQMTFLIGAVSGAMPSGLSLYYYMTYAKFAKKLNLSFA
ncbi:MAG: hypothetical protein KME59_23070 [Trichormus sp. ATA11-4-KO1]|jgi:hypothetical protein|nr:hypothetical protein [Trichormus sp. ATA11-4-KO1]